MNSRGAFPCLMVFAAVPATVMPRSAAAFEFTLGEYDDVKGTSSTTLSIATGWRVQNRNPALYSPANGDLQGLPTDLGGNADDGNLNCGKGDNFVTGAALVSSLELSKAGYGGLVKVSAWYDYTQIRRGVPHGNEANNYAAGEPLSDRGFDTLARFEGVTVLDAYAYGNWQIGENALQARLGRQAVNWGKGLVVQRVDQINPIEITTLRIPGTRLDEALIPVGRSATRSRRSCTRRSTFRPTTGGRSVPASSQRRWAANFRATNAATRQC